MNPSPLGLFNPSYARCSLGLRSETILAWVNVLPHGRQKLRSCLDLKPFIIVQLSESGYLLGRTFVDVYAIFGRDRIRAWITFYVIFTSLE